jgi:hypothetical protein
MQIIEVPVVLTGVSEKGTMVSGCNDQVTSASEGGMNWCNGLCRAVAIKVVHL